jgi:hypothetical protein
MRLAISHSPVTILVIATLAVPLVSQPVWATGRTFVATNGVTIRVLEKPFSGDNASLESTGSERLSLEHLPTRVSNYAVLETKTAVVAYSGDPGVFTFWTRQGGRLDRQGEVRLSSTSGSSNLRIVADDKHGAALEIGDRQEGLQQIVALSKDGILEIRQPVDRTVSVRSALRYILVPSLVGTDLLFDPVVLPRGKLSYLPSLNMVVGLQAGGNGMLTAVWPPGDQLACVRVNQQGRPPAIESFQIETDGQPVFIGFINHPNIWHAEQLREEYLETDTPIQWKKPFDARWIGRFFIHSEGYDFPFYFLAERHKLWGRYIRGWFDYPVWFDGDKTMVHFEKKFPPIGQLLIYYLDTSGDGGPLSPVDIMRKSLAQDVAAILLDFEGTRQQVLLEHRNAVCAMTYKIEAYFAEDAEAPPRAEAKQYADDIATFIRLIRERVFQFDRFAAETQELLQAQRKNHPGLVDALKPCEESLVEIREIVAGDLPETSLDEVGQWTDRIQKLVPNDEQNSLATVKVLTQKCRSVAGTQDDMARNLSVVTIRLMEEAARMGIESPQHVRVAEQVIARCRAILRKPTWWEPCRRYMPKPNPGAP